MLDGYLVQTCQKVSTTQDAYGDHFRSLSNVTLSCRFRDITMVRRGTHEETNDSDAMMWFAPDAEIERGTIILFEEKYYQIERITKARRLGETTVQFLKCDVKFFDTAIS